MSGAWLTWRLYSILIFQNLKITNKFSIIIFYKILWSRLLLPGGYLVIWLISAWVWYLKPDSQPRGMCIRQSYVIIYKEIGRGSIYSRPFWKRKRKIWVALNIIYLTKIIKNGLIIFNVISYTTCSIKVWTVYTVVSAKQI